MTFDGLAPGQDPRPRSHAAPQNGNPAPQSAAVGQQAQFNPLQMFGFHQLNSATLNHLLSHLPSASSSGTSTPPVGANVPPGLAAAAAAAAAAAGAPGSAGPTPFTRPTALPPVAAVPIQHGSPLSRSDSDPPNGAAAANNAPSSGRAPSHRSRNGCYTCRRRKVKCDERTPVCIKCEYSDRKCEWPPDDPLIRRKNRPRKMKLHLAEAEERSNTPPQLDERTKRTMRVPLQALQAFAATLPPGKEIKGYDKGFSASLMPPTLRANMMMDSAFLEPYFPAVDERLIFRHYISRTVQLSIAFDDPKSTWNPWLNIIAPLAFTHLPGVSPAADALRAALLTIGSVHLHYIANPRDQAGASRIMRLARPTVLGLVRKALEGSEGKEVDKHEVELILAALLGSIVASSLAADDGWHPLLESVIAFVGQMGGAQSLLRDAPRDHLSPARFVLEQLAIRDVFGCMTTEAAPTILRDAFTPWFFEAESWSRTDQEWESVERMFGISRGMVDLIARTCGLVSQVQNVRKPESSSPSHKANSTADLEDEAEGLMAELKVWDEACNFTPYHPRTQYGNIAHRHAMTIKLLRDVFSVPAEDERVYDSARAILELAVEMVVQYGTMVWLTWPVVIAAFQLPKDDEMRDAVRNLLSNPGPHSCFDMHAAKSVVEAYWEYHDEDGHHQTAWEQGTRGRRPFFD